MGKIKFFHLSDFHFDGNIKDLYATNKVLKTLLNTIEEYEPDLIFVTGDIGNKGIEKDYEYAKEFFEDLLDRTKIKKDRLWFVPGNHDVNRAAGRFLKRTIDNNQESEDFFSSSEGREVYVKKFNYYKQFLENFFPGREFSEDNVTHKPSIVTINNFHIGILPINSAWFSQDDNDKGNLWIGKRIIEERADYLRNLEISPNLIIAMFHHPYSYLHENEKIKLWLHNKCDIILKGHLHEPDFEFINSLGGEALELSAGAAYQPSNYPCRILFLSLDIENCKLQIEPFIYTDHPKAKKWVKDPFIFPDKQDYIGEVILPITVPNNTDNKEKNWNDNLKEGFHYFEISDYLKAENCFDEILKNDENFVIAWISKGVILAKQENYKKAIEYFDKALEIDSNLKIAWNNKGLALYNLDKYNEAIECFNKALNIDPTFIQAEGNKEKAVLKIKSIKHNLLNKEPIDDIIDQWDNLLLALKIDRLPITDQKIIVDVSESLKFNYKRAKAQESLTRCMSNIKNIATALEMFATDNFGDYPQTLDILTNPINSGEGRYILKLPHCPACGKDYIYEKDQNIFELKCGGFNAHIDTEYIGKGYYPAYIPTLGFIHKDEER